MKIVAAPDSLFRVGERPNSGRFPDVRYLKSPAKFRFDDPLRRFLVLYAASSIRGATLEVLADFRAAPEVIATYLALTPPKSPPAQTLPSSWINSRDVAELRIRTSLSFLDLRSVETREHLRRQLSPTLARLRVPDFDLASALSPQRALTQAVANWAYDRGYAGVAYPSRIDATETCWAVFDRDSVTADVVAEQRLAARPEFEDVMRLFAIERGL